MTRGEPGPLARSLDAELARLGGNSSGAALTEIAAGWPDAVGPAIAANSWPARVARDGTLVVHASSSTWAFELTQLAGTVRDRLGELAPSALRFVVGPLPAPDSESVPKVKNVVPRANASDRAKAAELAHPIEDPALRELVARAAAASLAAARRPSGPTASSDRLESA